MRSVQRGWALTTLVLLVWSGQPGDAHDSGGHQKKQHSTVLKKATPHVPMRITMEELHQRGGVPKGWKFALPKGDRKRGREVFVRMECYSCHAVQGEPFPAEPEQAGPDLTGMGVHHPASYFAESIVNPNRIIIIGEGYTGPDGLSTMPDYNDELTVTQLADLVAYLKSLRGPMKHKAMEHGSMKHKGMGHGAQSPK